MEKTINKEEMVSLLKSHGWYTIWNENNWVHSGISNKDWGGRSLESAYQQCLDDIEDEQRIKSGKSFNVKL